MNKKNPSFEAFIAHLKEKGITTFTHGDVVEFFGDDGARASTRIQNHLRAQRNGRTKVHVARIKNTRTRTARYQFGTGEKKASNINDAFISDVVVKFENAALKDLEAMAVVDPKVRKNIAKHLNNLSIAVQQFAEAIGSVAGY